MVLNNIHVTSRGVNVELKVVPFTFGFVREFLHISEIYLWTTIDKYNETSVLLGTAVIQKPFLIQTCLGMDIYGLPRFHYTLKANACINKLICPLLI